MRAVSSMATRHVLGELLAAAADRGLPAVRLESVGGVSAAQRVIEGEPFDLVLLAEDALGALAGEGHVHASSLTPLMVSSVVAAVPAGPGSVPGSGADSGLVAFADAAALRAALRAAPRIGYSTGPSGTALVRMLEDWGLGDELRHRLVQARPGVPVAQLLARGEADLGFQQRSELIGQPGVRTLGVLPADCAIDTVFAGAVAVTTTACAEALDVLAFLRSDEAIRIIGAHGFDAPRCS
ncbi:molybdate transport system substrate-binding protein [Microbacterium resistens]|uniref:Molybdate transport system substrate-binding protein n=1 Tax=Microbacterium resistens TaxID=156977 RepID=A0ABU1SDA6_9MICO|nr:substrate-binding domain-containing protein [Microbacterium resistens]MDR6867591.1 molybdate transport system substrate-binding protein [Microbacterium resistens]